MAPVQCVPPSPSPLLIADSDEYVKKNMATLIREIVKHSPEVHNSLTFFSCYSAWLAANDVALRMYVRT